MSSKSGKTRDEPDAAILCAGSACGRHCCCRRCCGCRPGSALEKVDGTGDAEADDGAWHGAHSKSPSDCGSTIRIGEQVLHDGSAPVLRNLIAVPAGNPDSNRTGPLGESLR